MKISNTILLQGNSLHTIKIDLSKYSGIRQGLTRVVQPVVGTLCVLWE